MSKMIQALIIKAFLDKVKYLFPYRAKFLPWWRIRTFEGQVEDLYKLCLKIVGILLNEVHRTN